MLTLTEGWLVTFGLLTLLGLLMGQGLLVGLGTLVLLTWVVAWSWNRASLARVTYERDISSTRAFIGETISVRLRLTNKKALPMPWVRLQEQFPLGLPEVGKERVMRIEHSSYPMAKATSLAQHERVTWRFTLECRERGYYRFGPAKIESGDVFGFFTSERVVPGWDHVIVYPQTLPLPALGLPARRPFGDTKGGYPFHEDPTRLRGLREYVPDDPLRRVDWKATARAQTMQARVYDPSVTHTLVVALNVNTLTAESGRWGYSPALLERGVTAAASISQWAIDQKYNVGFLTNSVSLLTDEAIRVAPSRSPQQLAAVLEGLAVASPMSRDSMANFIAAQMGHIPGGATIILVTGVLDEELIETVYDLRRHGYAPSIVWTADSPPPSLPDGEALPIHPVGAQMAQLEAEMEFRPSLERRSVGVGTGGQ